MRGIDASVHLGNQARFIKDAGYGVVGRYLSPNTPNHPEKQLTPAEVLNFHGVGLGLISYWESGFPTGAGYFTSAQGSKDAGQAILAAKKLHQPSGSGIYATVDYDASASNLGRILAYFQMFHDTLKRAGFLTGIYGSDRVIDFVWKKGFAHWRSLAQATAWGDDYHGYAAHADIVQGPTETIALGSVHKEVDLFTLQTQGGAW